MKKLISSAIFLGVLATSVIPAFAQTSTAGATNGSGACMASAVDKRDTAVISAWGTFGTAGNTALQTRRDALKAAWVLSDKRSRTSALKAAWDAFRASSRSARKAFTDSKNAAWKQFYVDRKACRTAGEDNSNVTQDANL